MTHGSVTSTVDESSVQEAHSRTNRLRHVGRCWSRQELVTGAALVAIGVLALLLRIPGLTSTGLFRADAWVALGSRVGLGTAVRMSSTSPGFMTAERFWIGLDPGSSLWAQILPLLVGIAGVFAIYFLVRYWGKARWLALTAAFTVAVSPVATQYSTHVKQYSTDFLLACFLLWRAEATRRSPTSARLVGLGFGSAGAILISGSVAPVIVGSWLAVLCSNATNRNDRLRIVKAGVVMAALLGCVYLLFFDGIPEVLHRYWVLSDAFLESRVADRVLAQPLLRRERHHCRSGRPGRAHRRVRQPVLDHCQDLSSCGRARDSVGCRACCTRTGFASRAHPACGVGRQFCQRNSPWNRTHG